MYPQNWKEQSKKGLLKDNQQSDFNKDKWSCGESSKFDVYQKHPDYHNKQMKDLEIECDQYELVGAD